MLMGFNFLALLTSGSNSPEAVARRTTNDDAFGPGTDDLQRLIMQLRKPKSTQKILGVVEQRLQQKSRHWRRKSKTLTVIQYVLISGNPAFIKWVKANKKLIEALVSFKYLDSNNRDQGRSIREKAQSILSIVDDPKKLKEAHEQFEQQRKGVRTSIGAGRPSTASRTTLEAYRDSILEDSDDELFPIQSARDVDDRRAGLGVIQEEH